MTQAPTSMTAAEVAAAVSSGAMSATQSLDASLQRIAALNPTLNAFTDIVAERARRRAAVIDAQGGQAGPLSGVVVAAKNLFDVAGLPTRAGSKINRDRAPAAADATLIQKLEASGAILAGALNMGEYAYDFTGENAHDGASRNPHDPEHMSGGSSGGSASAVASGMAAIALGSDTNGSIRVPSSFCGLFGLKPTYGRLSRAGTFPFVSSLDHLGPLARSSLDLALAYDAMQGADPRDPAQAKRPVEPVCTTIEDGVGGLRIARAGGYFARGAHADAFEAVDQAAQALGVARTLDIPEAQRARAAAFLITMAEGATLHAERLRARAHDYDPEVRDRLIAGLMTPGAWVVKAQKFRRWYRDAVLKLFEEVDAILAPATPCRAPRIGQKTMTLDGVEMPVRANLGAFTQPISFIGLPVVSIPTWKKGERLPIGVQIIGAPWREDIPLRIARALERQGVARAPVAAL